VPRLLKWHAHNKRSFVWRSLRRKPYVVLVSEYMLQQTGVKHIEKRLPIFLKQFPTVKALAAAPQSKVLLAWQGLGYNRRALYLHKAAMALAEMKSFPNTLEALTALPGVGRYTASAVLCFSMKQDVAVVDVNIERVLSRIVKRMKSADSVLPMQMVIKIDEEVLPKGRSSEWHEALMDLGSTICTKRSPKCADCPLNTVCKSAFRISNTATARKAETTYFGAPMRIWRGRVLKLIASKPATIRSLHVVLSKQFEINDTTLTPLIDNICHKLITEGLITKSKHGTLSLAD
jgi:A/G-specific adenine glycosylase